MLIECRVETPTESGWPEVTGSLNPLCLALREKRQDAKPERQPLSKVDVSSIRFRAWSRIQNECSDDRKNLFSGSKMQILRVCRPWGQLRAWVPGKQLEKVVDETTKLRPSGFAQQGIIRGGSAQSDTVDPFDDNVGALNVPDMRTKTGAGQVCSAAPAEDRRKSRSAEGKWVVFATHWTSVSERGSCGHDNGAGQGRPIPNERAHKVVEQCRLDKRHGLPAVREGADIDRRLL